MSNYNQLKNNSIYNLNTDKPKRTKRAGVRVKVTKQNGYTTHIRLYKKRRGCSTIKRLCVVCQSKLADDTVNKCNKCIK